MDIERALAYFRAGAFIEIPRDRPTAAHSSTVFENGPDGNQNDDGRFGDWPRRKKYLSPLPLPQPARVGTELRGRGDHLGKIEGKTKGPQGVLDRSAVLRCFGIIRLLTSKENKELCACKSSADEKEQEEQRLNREEREKQKQKEKKKKNIKKEKQSQCLQKNTEKNGDSLITEKLVESAEKSAITKENSAPLDEPDARVSGSKITWKECSLVVELQNNVPMGLFFLEETAQSSKEATSEFSAEKRHDEAKTGGNTHQDKETNATGKTAEVLKLEKMLGCYSTGFEEMTFSFASSVVTTVKQNHELESTTTNVATKVKKRRITFDETSLAPQKKEKKSGKDFQSLKRSVSVPETVASTSRGISKIPSVSTIKTATVKRKTDEPLPAQIRKKSKDEKQVRFSLEDPGRRKSVDKTLSVSKREMEARRKSADDRNKIPMSQWRTMSTEERKEHRRKMKEKQARREEKDRRKREKNRRKENLLKLKRQAEVEKKRAELREKAKKISRLFSAEKMRVILKKREKEERLRKRELERNTKPLAIGVPHPLVGTKFKDWQFNTWDDPKYRIRMWNHEKYRFKPFFTIHSPQGRDQRDVVEDLLKNLTAKVTKACRETGLITIKDDGPEPRFANRVPFAQFVVPDYYKRIKNRELSAMERRSDMKSVIAQHMGRYDDQMREMQFRDEEGDAVCCLKNNISLFMGAPDSEFGDTSHRKSNLIRRQKTEPQKMRIPKPYIRYLMTILKFRPSTDPAYRLDNLFSKLWDRKQAVERQKRQARRLAITGGPAMTGVQEGFQTAKTSFASQSNFNQPPRPPSYPPPNPDRFSPLDPKGTSPPSFSPHESLMQGSAPVGPGFGAVSGAYGLGTSGIMPSGSGMYQCTGFAPFPGGYAGGTGPQGYSGAYTGNGIPQGSYPVGSGVYRGGAIPPESVYYQPHQSGSSIAYQDTRRRNQSGSGGAASTYTGTSGTFGGKIW